MNKTFTIIRDTREQTPFTFEAYDCEVAVGTLKTGDYSVAGYEDKVSIERKALSDLIGCLTGGRERFERELARLRDYESCAVIVESPFRYLANGKYRSNLNPVSAVQSVISMTQKFRLPFFFAETRPQAEYIAFHFLRHFVKHHAE